MKRKRIELTNQQKIEIIKYKDNNAKASINSIKEYFDKKFNVDIGISTLYSYFSDESREKYLNSNFKDNAKRQRNGKFPKVEEALVIWLYDNLAHGMPISEDIALKQAMKLRDYWAISELEFTCSKGWLDRVRNRRNLKNFKFSGESADVNLDDFKEEIEKIKIKIQDFDKKDVFNCDETALFYQLTPNTTLGSRSMNGSKLSKKRITLCFCANADGSEKLKPILIGNCKKPRDFGNFNPSKFVFYEHNQKAWMTMNIFKRWLNEWNRNLVKQDRKILLLLDNAACHNHDLVDVYSNIELAFLPPNTTSKIQPMDQGIIKSFKAHYRSMLVEDLLEQIEANKSYELPKMKKTIIMSTSAWSKVTKITIENCFKHSGLIEERVEENDKYDQVKLSLIDRIRQLGIVIQECEEKETCTNQLTVDEFIDYDG